MIPEILCQIVDHAGRDPGLQVLRAAVQQDNRLALAAVDVVNFDAAEVGVFAVLDRVSAGTTARQVTAGRIGQV